LAVCHGPNGVIWGVTRLHHFCSRSEVSGQLP
jgi:hypothetical protein